MTSGPNSPCLLDGSVLSLAGVSQAGSRVTLILRDFCMIRTNRSMCWP